MFVDNSGHGDNSWVDGAPTPGRPVRFAADGTVIFSLHRRHRSIEFRKLLNKVAK